MKTLTQESLWLFINHNREMFGNKLETDKMIVDQIVLFLSGVWDGRLHDNCGILMEGEGFVEK